MSKRDALCFLSFRHLQAQAQAPLRGSTYQIAKGIALQEVDQVLVLRSPHLGPNLPECFAKARIFVEQCSPSSANAVAACVSGQH